ncbi:MAG: EAL domain-containing protein [Betaproteobacteria bacterium]|nr:EAL domain-containing protein [Betaproteobacteria bacterium]
MEQALIQNRPVEFEGFSAMLDKWLELRLYPFEDGLALYMRDISARHQAQAQLLLLHTCIARLNDLVLIAERRGQHPPQLVFANAAFSRLTGYSAQEVVSHHPGLLVGPGHAPEELERLTEALRRGQAVRTELMQHTKEGVGFWVDLEITPVSDSPEGLMRWIAVGRDITARKSQEQAFAHLAYHDALTGLPNRQSLIQRLHASGRPGSAPPCIGALMFIDLDHFKLLNDTLGHDRGDQLLQQVAQRLLACVRETDLVARLSGDEFVVVMHELARQEDQARQRARQAGEMILHSLRQPHELAGQPYYGTCSIGVTLLREPEPGVADLLKQADLAMYQAKASGRNTLCFFDPLMQASASAKAALTAALRQALHEQQFVLHYEPQVNSAGCITGVAALLRWQHPTAGLRRPKDFIGQAEESGLILPLGQWVLESACRQLALWSQRPLCRDLKMAVNVSARQFLHPHFVQDVLQTAARHGVPVHQLELEITESLLAADIQGCLARLQQLHQAGVSLAIDDFGMGYSALSCLKQMPLQRLKIDRAFVRDMLEDRRDVAITRTIVQLARDLGLEVMAEGVETQAQRELLEACGCDAFQGYLFSPAVPAEALEALIARGWSAEHRAEGSAPTPPA